MTREGVLAYNSGMRKWLLGAVIVGLVSLCAVADSSTAKLTFVVTKVENGKPVRNASVILHPVNKDGRQEKGGLQLKTDPEGRASLDGVPYGKLRVQVIAPRFQTFGQDYEVNQPEQQIDIKLEAPQKQYSIYDK
jgi:hypothetical protein